MDEDRLQELMQSPEGENLELKQALLSRKAIGEYAVGIGNEGGGWLILSVSDKLPREIVGIGELSAAELQQIRDAVLDATGIRVEPHVVPSAGRMVLALRIPGRPRGQIFSTRSGKYLMRSGEGLRGMTLTEIEAIRTEELRYRDVLADPVDVPWQEVLDGLEIRRLRRVLTEKGREELARLDEEELLRSLELLAPSGRSGTTRAAILLVGNLEAIREYPLRNGSFDRQFARLVRKSADEGAYLSVFDLLILIHLRRHREITLADAAKRSQQPVDDARRILDRLRNHGLLERQGPADDRRWVLSPRAYEELNLAADRERDLRA